MPIDSSVFFSVLKGFTSKSRPTVPPAEGWLFLPSLLLFLPPSADTLPQFLPNCSRTGSWLGDRVSSRLRWGEEKGCRGKEKGRGTPPPIPRQGEEGEGGGHREAERQAGAGAGQQDPENSRVHRRNQAWRTVRNAGNTGKEIRER